MLNEEAMDWEPVPGRQIASALCGDGAVTNTVKGHALRASSVSVIMISDRG